MAAKSAHEAAKAKAAKEKKILAALALPLVGALFFAYHTVTKLNASDAPAPVSATSTTAAPPTATVATGSPVSATVPAAPPTLPADSGKLARLGEFPSKDPFFAHGPKVTTTGAQSSSSGPLQKTKPAKQQKTKPAKQQKTATAPPTAAVIAVNGRLGSVPVGTAFPVAKSPGMNGVFKLISLTAKSAKIAVVDGSYASGAHTLTLTVNSVVTLVNTADGKKFTLVLYPVGTPVPGAPQTTPTTTTSGP